MKKALLPVIAFMLVLIFCSCGTSETAKITGSDELMSFVEKLDNGKLNDALALYSELDPEEMTKANKSLSEHVGEIEAKYASGTYDFSTSKILLEGYEGFAAVKDIAGEILERITTDNNEQITLAEAGNYQNSGKYDQAISALKTITASSKYYDEAVKLLESCISSYRSTAIAASDEAIASEDYAAAFEKVNDALSLLPGDTELTLYLDNITGEYEKYIIAKAEELFADDPDGAIKLLKDAAAETDSIKNKLNSLKEAYAESIIKDALAEAKELAESKNYTDAIKVLENAKASWFDASKLTEKINAYSNERSSYLENIALDEAEALADKKDWEGAVSRLEQAQNDKMIYNKSSIKSKIEEYTAKYPKKLTELNCIQSEAASKPKYHDDIFGNYYDDVIEFDIGYNKASKSSIYILNRNYNTFEATVFANNNSTSERYYTLKIYGDDALLAAYSTVMSSAEPIKIKVDITGFLKLKIEAVPSSDGKYGTYYVGIGNPIVSNK